MESLEKVVEELNMSRWKRGGYRRLMGVYRERGRSKKRGGVEREDEEGMVN
ncbi:MAG: hypothetical protein U0Z75_07235 [Deinococcaceae bacterium]